MNEGKIKKAIKAGYAKIAKQQTNSCCGDFKFCCGNKTLTGDICQKIGYTEEELREIPANANLGLGCGNPVAISGLQEGEIVLDLGSGAGVDCFLAAKKVGPKGRVIGVDMTPEMIEKAAENARKGNFLNVEFRLGEIENLPVEDNSIDAVISNCVINLSPAKKKVFKEIYRVLKPGGRFVISDIVLARKLPEYMKNSIEAYIACISGAIMREEYINIIKTTGFQEVRIINEAEFPLAINTKELYRRVPAVKFKTPLGNLLEIQTYTLSITVSGIKPQKCWK